MERLLEMGQAGKAHGIKGELALVWHGDVLPEKGQELIFEDSAGARKKYILSSLRKHKGFPLVFLEGVADRDSAEALRGSRILMSSGDIPPLDDDESWLADLLGLDVSLENGEVLGRLDHVEFPAGQEIWSIVNREGREILFPAKPCFLVNVDESRGIITIRPPEGLLEIYNA